MTRWVAATVAAVGITSVLVLRDAGDSLTADAARVRRHLAEVESELRARSVVNLSRSQREARQRQIDALHRYWRNGRFPHNHEHPGERLPSFVDRHGTRCAMAELMWRSEGEHLVRRLAATCNHARIADLAHDPELVAWLDHEGLSIEEAARIQPSYGYDSGEADHDLQTVAILTAVPAAMGITTIALNIHTDHPWRERRVRGLLAVGTGLMNVAIGSVVTYGGTNPSDPAVISLGIASLSIGLVSFGLGIRNLNTDRPAMGSWAPTQPDHPAWSMSPYLRVNSDGSPQAAVLVAF